jgi:hypothetical protein
MNLHRCNDRVQGYERNERYMHQHYQSKIRDPTFASSDVEQFQKFACQSLAPCASLIRNTGLMVSPRLASAMALLISLKS